MMCGSADVELTAKGKLQADTTGQQLKDVQFDAAYCSTMIRAKQTAAEILKYHKGVPIFYDDRLRERKAGDLEGLQESFYPFIKDRWNKNFDCDLYNYESVDALFARVHSFLASIEHMKQKNILIVAHSGISRVFKAVFSNPDEKANLSVFGMENGEIMILPF